MELEKRHSLYDISWKVTEEEYRADSAYSYSTISRFNREGFDKIKFIYDKVESPSLLFGSMVDTLLTDGQEEFDKKYLIASFPEIADSIITIVKDLFVLYADTQVDISDIKDEDIIKVASKYNYQNNWKPETRAKVIKEKGSEYYKLLYIAQNKTIVSSTDYNVVVECVQILKEHEATKIYFEKDSPFNSNIERFYQLKFKSEYKGIPIRCMMDEVIVDHTNKIIIPIDLKTSYKPEWRFYKSYIDWGYYIQSNLYTYILEESIKKDPIYKDYKVLDYRFIVISKNTKTPLVWIDKHSKTVNTIKFNILNLELKNWRSILIDLHYYMTQKPLVPKNIDITGTNEIHKWIEENDE